MIGLLMKDLLNLKRQGVLLGAFALIYLVISVFSGQASFFIGVVMILCAILPVTALSYDERAKWDKYALTMPVRRSDIVIGKYVLGLILIAVGFALSVLCGLLLGEATLLESILPPLFAGGIGSAMLCVIMPLLFRFGVEKARIVLILVCMLPAAAIVAASKLAGENVIITIGNMLPSTNTMVVLAVLAILLLFMVSLLISLSVYEKKEF